MNCKNCDKRILNAEEEEGLQHFIKADAEFSGGEFIDEFDYYEEICMCCVHSVDPRLDICGPCHIEERLAWEEEMRATLIREEGSKITPAPRNGLA